MTDEEKAEEIARRISNPCLHITCNQYCSMVKQAYLDGLAEGRKEVLAGKVIENLKENTSVINSVIMSKLSEKCEQLKKENAELSAQIEHMKCCENCKHYYGCDGGVELCNRWEP